MKRLLTLIPFVPATFVFYGLYAHADPFFYYTVGASVMVLAALAAFGIDATL